MPRYHPDPEQLARFLRDELAPRERRQVVRHLLAGCAQCLETTRPLWRPGGGAPADTADPHSTAVAGNRGVLHPASYNGVFEKVFEVGRRREQEIAVERGQAPWAAAQLLKLPHGRRLAALHRDRRFHTVALCQLLLARSREALRKAPAAPDLAGLPRVPDAAGAEGAISAMEAALELAELALGAAERLEPRRCGRTVVQGLRARGWAYLGDARRLAGDLAGAERALQLAVALLPEEPSDPLEAPEILSLQAALATDRGRLVQADRLLDRVLAVYRVEPVPALLGRALVQRGVVAARAGRRESAIRLLREGAGHLDETADVRVLARALHLLLELLQEEGRQGEALLGLQRLRPLYGRLGDRQNLVRLRWLEGRLELGRDRPQAALKCLGEARAGFVAEGLGREAALASLDLAVLHARGGRWDEVRLLAGGLFPIFRMGDLRREGAAALLVFQQAVESQSATPELLAALAGYLLGSRRQAAWAAA
jgi:tetratricopeptide (TPR) repeat protein